jgi:hypothetical protein
MAQPHYVWASHHWASFNLKKEGHEKPATAKGRPEERSLLTATGLLYPERQPFGLPFGLPSMVE